MALADSIPSASFLERCFLKWILEPATKPEIAHFLVPQSQVEVGDRNYFIDYEIVGSSLRLAVELDGFAYHSDRQAFTYDRLRQNDLHSAGRTVIRFSYDAIRFDTERCVRQLQALLSEDAELAEVLVAQPVIETPDDMEADPLFATMESPASSAAETYFDLHRDRINDSTLRTCQREAFSALANYFGKGGRRAATVMSVGAGKTALGVIACLGFSKRRAMIVTPGSVIRGTFDLALDATRAGNVLYGLPSGALIPGCAPPVTQVLDREDGPIRDITREELLSNNIIVTNFHSLGTGSDPDDLLSKLGPDDIDLIVVDEAHIAASDSYQRLFAHFENARTVLMSACFQRLDGRPIDADVVYRYRLIDSIVDGHAKQLRVRRFAPRSAETDYEIVWPNGTREEIRGREAFLEVIKDEKKLARVTARSTESMRQVMRSVRQSLDAQARAMAPIKPRVLFSAMGKMHAEQISALAIEFGIPCGTLHHSMSRRQISQTRQRFESEAGDLQGIVQLKMLGQGYDFPPICVVAPMRPYGSFGEFYQFVGRGIRVIQDSALRDRVAPEDQWLDVVYHGELDLDRHIDTIYAENDMDPQAHQEDVDPDDDHDFIIEPDPDIASQGPQAFVMFERGDVAERVVHDEERVHARKNEREREAFAGKYAEYASSADDPITFDQYVNLMRQMVK